MSRIFSAFGAASAAAAVGFMCGGTGAAYAAPGGCEAIDDYVLLDRTWDHNSSYTVGGFNDGDTVYFTVNITSTNGDTVWKLSDSSGNPITSFTGAGSYTTTQTVGGGVTGFRSAATFPSGALSGVVTVTARCGPPVADISGDLTDSDKVEVAQVVATRMSARASAVVQTTSVSSAISDAFSATVTPVTMSNGGLRLNYAPETAPGLEWTAAQRLWSLWADFRYTSWDAGGGGLLDGDQLNALLGFSFRIDEKTLVGAFGGYETFDISMERLDARLEGDGGTFGVYTARYLLPNLRWDVIGSWSGISYDADAGAATGSFDGSRWQLSTGLTGTHELSLLTLEPSARLQGLWETQDAWVDSLGALQTKQNFSSARATLGGRAIMPLETASEIAIAPYLGLYGDYNFGDEGLTPVGNNVGIDTGLSARVTAGATLSRGRGSLLVGGELGGLGGDERYWSGNLRGIWAF